MQSLPPIIQKYVNDRLNLSIVSTDFEKYYLSRVGLNMYELTTGEYIVVFEIYFPTVSIDHSSVDISATSSVGTISRVSINKSADLTRSWFINTTSIMQHQTI